MNANAHSDCYGRLFPVGESKNTAGIVFAYGGARPGMAASPTATTLDLETWDRCTQCGDFEMCYRLSIAHVLCDIASKQ